MMKIQSILFALFFSLCVAGCGGNSGGGGTTPTPVPSTAKEWTWVSGSSANAGASAGNGLNQAGVYGTLGVATGGNVPGGRVNSVGWTDKDGNLWLFGGNGVDSTGTSGYLNDLWEFNVSNKEWAWINGSSTVGPSGNGQPGVYGTLGSPGAGNVPGGRSRATSWTDAQGNLWLSGGYGEAGSAGNDGELNDIWEFSPSLGQWAWMGGSSTIGANGGLPSTQGTLGVPAAGNIPGSRDSATGWVDANGNLWLFGGNVWLFVNSTMNEPNGVTGDMDDLWEFNPSTKEWAWMGGGVPEMTCSSFGSPDSGYEYLCYSSGVYGTLGTPAAGNLPQGRTGAVSWTDGSGNLWLFGGYYSQFAEALPFFPINLWMNDLWEFNPSTKQWAWMGGSAPVQEPVVSGGPSGVYGTLGTPAATNTPGGRQFSASWTDSGGNFWLFGGSGSDSEGNQANFNDLWMFNPATRNWVWESGSNTVGNVGVYGALGVAAAANVPGSRYGSVSWTDGKGNLWLFGGYGTDSTGTQGNLNDLWEYQP